MPHEPHRFSLRNQTQPLTSSCRSGHEWSKRSAGFKREVPSRDQQVIAKAQELARGGPLPPKNLVKMRSHSELMCWTRRLVKYCLPRSKSGLVISILSLPTLASQK